MRDMLNNMTKNVCATFHTVTIFSHATYKKLWRPKTWCRKHGDSDELNENFL